MHFDLVLDRARGAVLSKSLEFPQLLLSRTETRENTETPPEPGPAKQVRRLAEVAIPRQMFHEILRLIAELQPKPPPAPA